MPLCVAVSSSKGSGKSAFARLLVNRLQLRGFHSAFLHRKVSRRSSSPLPSHHMSAR